MKLPEKQNRDIKAGNKSEAERLQDEMVRKYDIRRITSVPFFLYFTNHYYSNGQ